MNRNLFSACLAVCTLSSFTPPRSMAAETCDLYPIALSAQQIGGAAPGEVLGDILNGIQPGNFGWLTWAGSPSEPTLVKSLTAPGDGATYVNPDDLLDHQISVGDWIQGKPGVSNAKMVREALEALKQFDVTIPVWDQVRGHGAMVAYRVSGFARVRLLGFQLPGQNRITARYFGGSTCGQQNQSPAVNAGQDLTVTLPGTAELEGSASDDGLPIGSTLSVLWTQLSGPASAIIASPPSTNTTVHFSEAGIYIFRLTASDGELSAYDDAVVVVNRPNQPPIAYSQTLTNPEDSILSIELRGSDPEGGSLVFVAVSTPSHGSLAGDPPLVHYTPLPDYAGPDAFAFKVSDGQLESEVATITITNLPINDRPVAASDEISTDEDTAVTFAYSGSDVDGDAITFQIVDSPQHGSLTITATNATYAPATDYHGPDAFAYIANDGQTDSIPALVAITVVSVDDAPTVDAGPDQLASLPTNWVQLSGSVIDDDFPGTSIAVEWRVISGPATVSFAEATNPETVVTFTTNGIYVLRLTATDSLLTNSDDVTIIVNAPPLSDAGTNQLLTLPAQATLTGVVSDDGLPTNQLSALWVASGPGTVIFDDPTQTNTFASFSESGIYGLLLVADDTLVRSSNGITVLVNRAPSVDAGSEQIITNLFTALAASAHDDGFPSNALNLAWTKVSGPGEVTFATNTLDTEVTFSASGTYVLRLTADDLAAQASGDVTIRINLAPVVDAGADFTAIVDVETNLMGSVEDDGFPEGAPLLIQWDFVSGPGTVIVPDRNSPSSQVRFTTPGHYVLRLTANDSELSGSDEVTISVEPQNQVPFVTAGQNQIVTLPDPVLLRGLASDDGLPTNGTLSVLWSQLSGPGDVDFASANQTNTTATFSTPGTYVLRLTASDTILMSAADVTVVVRTESMNIAPGVFAGADKVVGLTNVLLLDGQVTDDGLPRGSSVTSWWSQVSGPGIATFENPGSPASMVRFDLLGTYVLRLSAGDSALTTSDEVQVTVYPFNQPPVVNAGADQQIIVPDPAFLTGTGHTPTNANTELALSLFSAPRWSTNVGVPGFDAQTLWNSLSVSGTNLYAAGRFSYAGGNLVRFVARWDGGTWNPLYDPRPLDPTNPASPAIGFVARADSQSFNSVVARGDEVFVRGNIQDLDRDGQSEGSARWTGTGWESWYIPNTNHLISGAGCLGISSHAVYVGAEDLGFTAVNAADGQPIATYGIAKWDGTNWLALGRGVENGRVLAIIEASNGDVYAAGRFNFLTVNGMANNIARWDGTRWYALGAGLTASNAILPDVFALAVDESGNVYAGGAFNVAGGWPAGHVAKWDGLQWTTLGTGAENGVSGGGVNAIITYGRDIYVGGGFAQAGTVSAIKAARWNGEFWSPLGTGSSNGVFGSVYSLAAAENGIYASGDFIYAGGQQVNRIAFWEFPPRPDQVIRLAGQVADDGLPSGAALSATWTKISGPGNVTFSNPTGAITEVRFSQLGAYVLRLTGSDSDLSASDDVAVILQGNQPPVVRASEDQVIDLSATTIVSGSVTDDGFPPDTDLPFMWSVVYGPGTVTFGSINSSNSTVRFSTYGTYALRLIANDSQFNGYDDVIITVRTSDNFPPYGVARANPASLPIGQLTTLSAEDMRDDGRPFGVTNILWTQVSGPAPLRFFDPTSRVCQAMATVPGAYGVRVNINDGELTYFNDYGFTATTGIPPAPEENQAPVVNAGSDESVVAFQYGVLHGSVSDDGLPNGNVSAVWSRISGPANVYFSNAASADTTAKFYVTGTYVLRLFASDGRLSSFDDVMVTVVAPTNEGPLVVAGPNIEVIRPDSAHLTAQIFDDGLPTGYPQTFQWNAVSGPGTVAFSPARGNATNGFIDSVASFSSAGTYILRILVSDSQFMDSDIVTVTVLPGTNSPPYVNAGPDQTVATSEPTILHTEVLDDGLDEGFIEVSWSMVSGPGQAYFSTLNGIYRASFDTPGEYVLRLTATDFDLTDYDDVSITVYDVPNPPDVAIVSPADGQPVTFPSNMIGTASSPILSSYVMQYRLARAEDDPDPYPWVTFAQGTASVVDGPLGLFDPTLLLNGTYEIQLVASDLAGRISSTNVFVILDRNLKVGNFTLSFNDLTIPVAGLPMQIIRTYDSRDKREGDFGVGWTLQLNDIRLQKNRHLGKAWDQSTTGGTFPNYLIDTAKPRIITITFPDNKIYKFGAALSPSSQLGSPLTYPRMTFVPLDNTRGSLTPVWFNWQSGEKVIDDQLVWAGDVPGRADFISWELLLDPPPGPADNILYNPDLFEFTTLEGYTYLISETNGLRSITDPNANTFVITTNGLTWTNPAGSSSLSVVFERDALGRITNILDAMGHAMSYRYDTNGNLVSFTDREGNTNGFTYDGRHGLLSIADARGIEAVRNEYDDSGRLIRHIDANGRRIDYAHDIEHRLEIITNRLGFVTISEYDERGNVVKVTDASGATTTSAYDANDNLVMTVDPLGRTNTFAYDDKDNRTSVTDALGNTTRATYNDLRRVTSATDARGNTVTNFYDRSGNLTALRDPLGNITSFAYSEEGLPLAMTNALGFVSQFEYDDKGRLLKEIDPLGHETTFQRDANGNLLTQSTMRTTSAGLETLTMFFGYDSQSRLTNSILPDGSSVRTIYNAISKAAATIDQLGRPTTFDYDEFGRLVRSVAPDGTSESSAYDAEGRRVASTNKLGQVTFFEYDAMGRLFRTIYADGTSTTDYFDLAGQVIASTDARGFSSFYGYDQAGRTIAVTNALGQVSRSIYDAAGNLAQTVDALGRTITFSYDALNRRTNTLFADGSTQVTAYDALGRRVSETDQAGIATYFGYDALGRLTSVTNAHGDVTRYEYNELGQQLFQIDANNHTTRFEYDSLGRRVKRTLPGGQVETYAYSIDGLLTNRTDFNGDRTAFIYDVMNRLVQKLPDPRRFESRVSFGYNELGLRTNMVDASGVTTYRYDNRNRLVEKATPQGTLFYAYDVNGNVTNIHSSNVNGVTLNYGYDELNRLDEVFDPHTGPTSYTYDEVGNLRSFTLPNAVNTFCRYNELNRLTNLNVSVGFSGVADFAYTIGPAGNRLSATETIVHDSLNNVATTINRLYSYDRLYRLTNEMIGGTSFASPATLDYIYDKVGNRLSLASTLASIPGVVSSFDLNDRLTTDTYDANGNTTMGRVIPNAPPVIDRYDFENRLVNRDNGAGQIVYDGDGNRVRKTANGVTTHYLVDTVNPTGHPQVLEELTSSNVQPAVVTCVYSYGHALLSQDQFITSGWTASYDGYDGHGNVRFLTDHHGFVTDTYDYDAFGNLIARTGTTPNDYLFCGEQLDPDLGLYYLRARYANSSTGRFWSMDEFEGVGTEPTSLHKYTYCGNNPVNCFDPSGNQTLITTMFAQGM